MDIYEAMAKRRSVRKYRKDAVPREVLEKLVKAGAMAPTGGNQQGWVFVVADDPAIKAKIAHIAKYGRYIADAGACIAVFCNRQTMCLLEDCSAAVENIMLAATAEGLGSCWVGSYKNDNAEPVGKLLGCPASHELAALVAVGVPEGETPVPVKKNLNEVMRWNKF
jgi:nitroreductase